MKRLTLLTAIMLYTINAYASPVPDTGQTKCYDVAGNVITCPSPGQALYGQDANYTINPMSYTKLDDSGNALPDSATSWVMVRDNVTGLIWENKTDDGTIHDKYRTYTWYDPTDPFPGTSGNGTDTKDFIDALNSSHFGSYSDWRLPTIKELGTIVNSDILQPRPTINATFFPNTQSYYYWSSTSYAGNTEYAYGVQFAIGFATPDYKNDNLYVRAVRGGQSQSAFIDNGNGTVTDTITGLMWQKETGSTLTWEQSLSYCENLNLAGYTDWRLPTIKELQSLVDYSRTYPAINTTYFPNTASSLYWSSTTYPYDMSYAYTVAFHDGYGGDYGKYGYFEVRAVRGGQSGASGHLEISPSSSQQTNASIKGQNLQQSSSYQVNTPFPVTFTAKDSYGNDMTWFNGTVNLSSNLGSVKPTSVNLKDGKTTDNVTVYYGGNVNLSASGSLTGQSIDFEVADDNANNGILTVTVNNYQNVPIANATVYLDGNPYQADSKGYKEFKNLPSKTYSVYATTPDGAKSANPSISISSSSPNNLFLKLDTCNPGKIPILLVPGAMGSSGDSDQYPYLPEGNPAWNDAFWRTQSYGLHDPSKIAGWRNLIDDLRADGYTMDCNLFAVPYDWRMPIQESTEKYLKTAIDYVKNKTGYTKVHIIAHSMGGLLTRYYIQSILNKKDGYNREMDIDRFAMVGTPNHGSAPTYYMYFGGDPKLADDSASPWDFLNFYSHTTQKLYRNMFHQDLFPSILNYTSWSNPQAKIRARDFYKNHVKSLGQLLPDQEFLMSDIYNRAEPYGLSDFNCHNTFLEDLNRHINFGSVLVRQFDGDNKPTIYHINTNGYISMYSGWYPGGTPIGDPDYTNLGDGTVLRFSSGLLGGIYEETPFIESSHASLINNYRTQIISFITGDTEGVEYKSTESALSLQAVSEQNESITPTLFLSFHGAVSPYLTTPSGKKIGYDPITGSLVNDFAVEDFKMDNSHGFFTIESPEDGDYVLTLKSNYQQDFNLSMGYTSDTSSIQISYPGFIGAGSFVIHFSINASNSNIILMDEKLAAVSNLLANPVQNNGLKTRLTWTAGTQEAITGYKIYSRLQDDPFLALLGTSILPSYDTDHDWAGDFTIPAHLYAVSAVLSDGTETFLADMVMNNDRDHDGLTDAEETAFGSDMTKTDTDGDGLSDLEEANWGTSPIKIDTDGDGYSDYEEVLNGTNPLDPASPLKKGDLNADGKVDLTDQIMCLQVLSGMLPDNINPAGDVDGDGKIGMAEAIYVMQVVSGLKIP